jgi:hypothetical protein
MEFIVKIKRIAFVFPVIALLLTGCVKSYNEDDVGYGKIYIPQATITGLDNSYPVPRGAFGISTSYTCYYKDGILHIALGVVRSGSFASQKAFSVNVAMSQEETTAYIARLIANGDEVIQLPSGTYQLPGSVNVESGNNIGTYYMAVDMRALASQSASLEGNNKWKKLALAVQISNPTEYELSDKNTSVVVVIDLNSVHWNNASGPESEVRTLFPSF